MKKITSLTTKQTARLTEFRDKWLAIGLSTAPANRPEAERGIIAAYAVAKLPPPKKIVWCGSPLSQGLTRAIIFEKKLPNIMRHSMRARVGASMRESVREGVGESVRDSVWNSVREGVGDSVGDSVRDSVWDSVREGVWDSVWNSVRESVGARVWNSVRDSGYGQHDAAWLGFHDFFREVCALEKITAPLLGLTAIAQSAGWFLPYKNICWVSERHSILERDERGRIHNISGPAIAYPDGWKIYAVHGVRVPEWIVEQPEKITTAHIGEEQNAEVRRVMLDRFGAARYLKEIGATLIDHDENFGTLRRADLREDEPLVMLEVVNRSKEPDGTYKHYTLRVPPNMETAEQAWRWLGGMNIKAKHNFIES